MAIQRRLLAPTSASVGAQPVDADLTTIAALDSSTAGALATDGSGWIRKTYAQLKTALSLTPSDVGLGSVTNDPQVVKLTLTAVKTSNYTAAANEFVPVDTTSGNVTVTFPTAPADGARVGIKHVVRGSTNTITVALGGADVFNVAGGATTGTVTLLNQATIFQYKSSGAIWYATGDDMPLSQLDLRFQPLDSDLTAIAGLTATTDNIVQSVGSAWASRTPAQVKTALALNNVDNTSDANAPVSTATQALIDARTVTMPATGLWSVVICPAISTTAATSAGGLRLAAWLVTRSVSIDRIGAEVTTIGDVGSLCRIGVYADNGHAYPGALLLDAGTIAGDSATVQSITCALTLPAGLYWVGLAGQSITVTPPTMRAASSWTPPVSMAVGTSAPTAAQIAPAYVQNGVTAALPGTFTATPAAAGSASRIHVRFA